jgi:hypothetical protein
MTIFRPLAIAAASLLVTPTLAGAATVHMHITGTVIADSHAYSFFGDGQDYSVDLSGQPVNIDLNIARPKGAAPYMTSFGVTWSGQTYTLPFPVSFSGNGFPSDYDVFGFHSNITFGQKQIDIGISPMDEWIAAEDADFLLNADVSYTRLPGKGGQFVGKGVTGTGNILLYLADFYFNGNDQDSAYSPPNFSISGLTTTAIPEPGVWTMLLAGLGGLGALARDQRRRGAIS